ncbi:MAG: SDR family oxidoreductase [Oscillochloris sp.]|nr:SDR family oxidoreductase [Oscillochloris sp.]
MPHNWTVEHIPSQNGKLALITGANSGIGYEAALALAAKGAQVILAVRNQEKGHAAAAQIGAAHPQAQVEVMGLDLANLAAVRSFAETFLARKQPLSLLINNAGVMALPFRRTADGFEMQFGTNHLGHFALTGLLLPAILDARAARVVTVSSGAHTAGTIDFDNFDGSRGYQRWTAYCQSKLANLLFAYELQRRFAVSGANAISVGCHPGFAATNLQSAGAIMDGNTLAVSLMNGLNSLVAQSAAMGALPTLYAATAPDIVGGDYIGPNGLMNMRGHPTRHPSSARSHDPILATRLWQVSAELAGVRYEQLTSVNV